MTIFKRKCVYPDLTSWMGEASCTGCCWGCPWSVAEKWGRSVGFQVNRCLSQICSVKEFWRKRSLSMCKFHMCKSHFSCWFSSFYLIPHLSPGSKPQVLFGVSALHCDENSLGNRAGLYSIDLGFLVAQGQTLFYLSVESSGMPGRDCVKQLHRRFI